MTDFHGDEAKKIKMSDSKKTEFFKIANSQKKIVKFFKNWSFLD